MSPALLGSICGAACFLAFLAAHIAILFLQEEASPSRTLVLTFAGAAAAAIVTVAILVRPEWAAVVLAEVYALMVMACLFILYAPFFFTIYTSLSVESLLIALRQGGRVPVDLLYQRFASREFFTGRLATMVASGYLAEEDGRYRLASRGRRVAAFFWGLKRAWRLGLGG